MNRSLCMAALALSATASASDVVTVSPIHDRMILVHLDDGKVIHHVRGQKRMDEKVIVDPLDQTASSRASSWQVSSSNDPAFRTPIAPIQVGRKTKGTEFAWFVDSWVNGRAVNTRPDYAAEHWVTLTLPRAMVPGRSYTVRTSLAKNGRAFTFVFEPRKTRSESVKVNHLGYVPDVSAKFGYIHFWSGDRGPVDFSAWVGRRFWLVDQATGKAGFEGRVAFRKGLDNPETFHVNDSPPHGNFLKADVYECDFSPFTKPGRYVLAVDGIGTSFPFEIKPDVYRLAFFHTARALYHNRSGIALKKPYTEFERPAPHNPMLTPGFKGKLMYTTVRMQEWGSEGGDADRLRAGFKGPLDDVYGWYQDAGDWDSYESHLRVPSELLMAYMIAPKNFSDGELNIPESKNGVPDILDEAAWLPRFCHRLRHSLLKKGWGTGGVGMRVAGDAFGSDGEGRGSWDDVDRIWAVSGEDPQSTYRYAGVAAHLALALEQAKVKDPEGVDWAKEARESYAWAQANTREKDDVKNARLYAAAALFRLTGEKTYEEQFAKDTSEFGPTAETWFEGAFGPAVYALGTRGQADPAILARTRATLLNTANKSLESANRRALRWGGLWSFPMLIGHQTTPWVMEVAVGYALTKTSDPARAKVYRNTLYTTADYFLGTNANNMTWVTGLGHRSPTAIFHMDAWYNGKGRYHPGLIPYSPWLKQQDFGEGPWSQFWAYKTLHPKIEAWPGNEQWFSNRCSPMGSEFTVHQNIGPAAAMYGILCGPKG